MYDFSTPYKDSAEEELLNVEDASPGFTFSPFVDSLFEPLPEWQQACIIWALVLLGWLLNSIVIKIYWRLKSSSRRYVLAMTFIDLVCLNFALLPRFFLLFLEPSLLREIVKFVRHLITMFAFYIYLSIPLCLALDRLVAVLYPHRLHTMLQRLRPAKIALFCLDVLSVISKVMEELDVGSQSAHLRIAYNCVWLTVLMQNPVIFVIYVIIAVKVRRSMKKMANQKHARRLQRFANVSIYQLCKTLSLIRACSSCSGRSGCVGLNATPLKIGLSVFLLMVFSLLPAVYTQLSGQSLPGYFYYFAYNLNVANFFVYLLVDKQFRAEFKRVFGIR